MRHIIIVIATLSIAVVARGHSPDPTFSGPLFEQNQWVPYKWKSGQVPPSWMRPAINAAAEDNNDTRRSKAARFGYSSSATATVRYGEPSGCGVNGIACMSRSAPTSYTVAFRKHGYVFDWGTLKWCQRYDSWPNGCFDVRNIMLDELGHVQILQHHVNYASGSDYRHALVQTVSRAKPRDGYNDHSYNKCDVATLQKKYDVPSAKTGISTCLDLATTVTLSKTSTSSQVEFLAHLNIADNSNYGKLRANALADRVVKLQRKRPSSSTWSTVGSMTWTDGAHYKRTVARDGSTWQYRAKFSAPDNEGLRGDVSPTIRID